MPDHWVRMSREELPPDLAQVVAAQEGREVIEAIRRRTDGVGGDVGEGPLPGWLAYWQDQLLDRVRDGRTTPDPHLDPQHPEVMIWLVYMPELLRCGRCATNAAKSITGTDEDYRCDGCGEVFPDRLHITAGTIPGRSYGAIGSHGPIVIQGGLCPFCSMFQQVAHTLASLPKIVTPAGDNG